MTHAVTHPLAFGGQCSRAACGGYQTTGTFSSFRFPSGPRIGQSLQVLVSRHVQSVVRRKGVSARRTARLTKAVSSGEKEGNSDDIAVQDDPNDIICSPPTLLRHPAVQAVAICSFYIFHVFILCRKTIDVPLGFLRPLVATLPESVMLSWEVIFGTSVVVGYLTMAGAEGRGVISKFLTGRNEAKLPTKLKEPEIHKKEMPETLMLLGLGYLASGYMGQAIDLLLCALAIVGVPLTLGVSRALQVLLSHLFWVIVGSQILHSRTKDFFTSMNWFKISFLSKNVLWQTLLGYWMTSFVSAFAININGLLRYIDFPIIKQVTDALQALPESATENILDQLKNPEGNDVLATVLGAIGPCFTGPIWEELLYRGFLLQALNMFMSLPTAVDVSCLVFALNHMNARAFAHLYLLGYLWCRLYIRTGNLLGPILIHMM